MKSILKGVAIILGLAFGSLILTAALTMMIVLMLAPYIMGPILIILVALTPIAMALLWPISLMRRERAPQVRPVTAPAAAAGPQRLEDTVPYQVGGRSMRIMKSEIGWVEWGVLAGVAVLISAEATAIIGGLGPIFAVIALGYLLVMVAVYWMYRQFRDEGVRESSLVKAQVVAKAEPTQEAKRLMKVDIFRDLTEAQLESVAAIGQILRVSEGQVLGVAGEPGDRLFIVIEGQAQLSANSAIGDITVRIAGPGESFPLAGLIGSGTLITSAYTMTDMELMVVPRSQLLQLCRTDTDLGMQIFATIADVLGTRYSRTLAHLTASAEEALRDAGFFANV